MNVKSCQQKGMLRGTLSAVLVLALLAPALWAQASRGAEVVVMKRDRAVIKGELLSVKGTDLLIMDRSTPGGVSVALGDVVEIKVIKRAKVGKVVGGALIGGAAGAGGGYLAESNRHGFLSGIDKAAGFLIGGGIGIVVGGLAGLAMTSDKEIMVAGTDPQSVSVAAARLRHYARGRQ